jgi:hypothetical protein
VDIIKEDRGRQWVKFQMPKLKRQTQVGNWAFPFVCNLDFVIWNFQIALYSRLATAN